MQKISHFSTIILNKNTHKIIILGIYIFGSLSLILLKCQKSRFCWVYIFWAIFFLHVHTIFKKILNIGKFIGGIHTVTGVPIRCRTLTNSCALFCSIFCSLFCPLSCSLSLCSFAFAQYIFSKTKKEKKKDGQKISSCCISSSTNCQWAILMFGIM